MIDTNKPTDTVDHGIASHMAEYTWHAFSSLLYSHESNTYISLTSKIKYGYYMKNNAQMIVDAFLTKIELNLCTRFFFILIV